MIKNHAWNLFMDDGKLFATRGGDEIYYLDEVAPDKAERLLQAYERHADRFIPPDGLEQEIELLVRAGALCEHPVKAPDQALTAGFKWVGREDRGLTDMLRRLSPVRFVSAEQAGLILIMRTTGPLSAVMDEYGRINKPHLLTDMGYGHTVSLGPLVFPGKTACLGCFTGRVTSAWGNVPPPERPGALDRKAFVAGLIADTLDVIDRTGTHPELVYQTVSFNLDTFKTQTDAVFTLPWCPYCFPDGYHNTGKLEWRNPE